jgi:hypothetical protein
MPFGPAKFALLAASNLVVDPLLPVPRHVMNRSRLHIHAKNSISFSQRNPHVAVGVEINRARTVQGCFFDFCPICRAFLRACSSERKDHPGSGIHTANPMVQDIGNVEVTA